MKKRIISIISLISLFLINFVSAQFFSGYNRFSFSDFLRSIDPQIMILGGLFLIFFILIFYPLSRVFKDSYGQPNKTIAGILAFIISTLIIYGINRFGFDIEGMFYGLGISGDLLYIILPIILLIGAIFIIWGFSRGRGIISGFVAVFLIFGALLTLLTLSTNIFYEKGLVLTIGVVMFLIGVILWWWKRRRKRGLPGIGIGSTWGRGKRQYQRAREYVDPRSRLDRAQARRQEAVEKRLAREELQRQRQMDRARGEAVREDRRRQTAAQPAQQQQRTAQRQEKAQQKQAQRQQQELNERQKQREKARKAGLREINKQVKIIDRQLRNPRISDQTRRVFEQRIRDLENRRVVFKRYGVGKGNI
jgi:hypothetical protein